MRTFGLPDTERLVELAVSLYNDHPSGGEVIYVSAKIFHEYNEEYNRIVTELEPVKPTTKH